MKGELENGTVWVWSRKVEGEDEIAERIGSFRFEERAAMSEVAMVGKINELMRVFGGFWEALTAKPPEPKEE